MQNITELSGYFTLFSLVDQLKDLVNEFSKDVENEDEIKNEADDLKENNEQSKEQNDVESRYLYNCIKFDENFCVISKLKSLTLRKSKVQK